MFSTTLIVNISVFWNVLQCSSLNTYKLFREHASSKFTVKILSISFSCTEWG